MNPRTLSAYAQRALENARAEAVRLGHDAIGAEHIVLGLLRGDGTASALFGRLGVPPGLVEQRLEASGRRRANRGPGAADAGACQFPRCAGVVIDPA